MRLCQKNLHPRALLFHHNTIYLRSQYFKDFAQFLHAFLVVEKNQEV